ncbi:hypothetical protein [Natrinema sp. SYSU A 869]|uniref:hypothetical protein n=1 Tax=Natrinema sp. SYSU A 869 TaxID=2871694 RepID=UPI0031F2ECC3
MAATHQKASANHCRRSIHGSKSAVVTRGAVGVRQILAGIYAIPSRARSYTCRRFQRGSRIGSTRNRAARSHSAASSRRCWQRTAPSFSAFQLRAQIGPDASEGQVRNRLEELHERDVVAIETVPAATTLYYIDRLRRAESHHRPRRAESHHPGEPRARSPANPLDHLSASDFLLLRESGAIRTLVLAGYQLSLVLFTLGIVLSAAGLDAPVHSDHGLWTAALNLLLFCVVIRIAERTARRVRSRRD